MNFRQLIGVLTFAGLLVLPALSPMTDAEAQKGPPWGQQAEESFRLGPGMGPRLMTEQEWQEHWKKMQSLSPEERQKYREEWHKKMVERARERGITMPETPGPYGPGKGPGGGQPGGGRPY
ncbi:MAG: hypothetical protein L0Y78_07065 [candidate division NC10 bacterium]|nr:hypothetical protein [candidate division NC10 bacterium]